MTCVPTFLKDSSWPADKYESSLVKRPVTTTNLCLDDISLESASLLQLQLVMEQLDLRTKLCIRDSSYRLAQSAERRHNHANLDDACGDEEEASGAFVTDRINEHTGSMDMETDTNPIGRSTTHLLFHRPPDTYSVPANDSLPFRSPRMFEKPFQRHGGRLEHNETYCGSCYGAEMSDECCNSCEEVCEAYRKKGWGTTNTDLVDQKGGFCSESTRRTG